MFRKYIIVIKNEMKRRWPNMVYNYITVQFYCEGINKSILPFTRHSLRLSAGWDVSRSVARSPQHVVEGGIEGKTCAHPQEHVRAQLVAGRPEVVFNVAGVFQVLRHRVGFFLCLERGQLKTQWTTILICQEIVQFGTVGIHPWNEILHAIQLNRRDPLACKSILFNLLVRRTQAMSCPKISDACNSFFFFKYGLKFNF